MRMDGLENLNLKRYTEGREVRMDTISKRKSTVDISWIQYENGWVGESKPQQLY